MVTDPTGRPFEEVETQVGLRRMYWINFDTRSSTRMAMGLMNRRMLEKYLE